MRDFPKCVFHQVQSVKSLLRIEFTVHKKKSKLATWSTCIIDGIAAKLPKVTCLSILDYMPHEIQ